MNGMPLKRVFGAIAFAGLLTVGSAMAAGPYDGQWSAHITFGPPRCGTGDFPVTVADSKVAGTYKGTKGSYQFSGTIAADGSFSGNFGKGAVTGKFSSDKFEGSFPGPEAACANGSVHLERAK
jgi:hypothetical protein